MNAAVLFGSAKSVNPCFAHENGWWMLPQVLLFKTIRIGWQLEKAAAAPAAPAPVSRGIPDPVGAASPTAMPRVASNQVAPATSFAQPASANVGAQENV